MQILYLFLILVLFLLNGNSSQAKVETTISKQKVIYLISTPRSCSTAFLRMMHARGDFEIFNEPGVQTYFYLHQSNWQSVLKTYHEVENHILQKVATHQHIFVKELGYAAYEYLVPESDFLKQQDYYMVFLIRNPHCALISHYKKLKLGIMQDILKDIMSYKKLYELFQKFQQKSINHSHIILAEELNAHPDKVVDRFCQQVKISFKKEGLSWKKLDANFSFEYEWNCFKSIESALHWYDKAMASTGFTNNTTSYAVNQNGQPTFEEIENPEHRAFYKQLYEENLPYYKLFLEEHKKAVNISTYPATKNSTS